MSGEKIIVAYCLANESVAQQIVQQLSNSGYEFDLVACGENTASLQNAIGITKDNIILLISDNFLKSLKCMDGGLSYLQKIINSGRTLPVIIDGQFPQEGGDGILKVPTKFERVSSVIKYMNYWQDEYLDLRKQKRSVPAGEEEAYNIKLKTVRSISSEVGEVLRFLRESYYCDYEAFKASKFLLFFQKFSTEEQYGKFAALDPVTVEEPETNKVIEADSAAVSTGDVVAEQPNASLDQERIAETVEDTSPELPQEASTTTSIIEEEASASIEDKELKEEAAIDSIVEELLEEQAAEEEAAEEDMAEVATAEVEVVTAEVEEEILDTELLAQELAQKLPDSSHKLAVSDNNGSIDTVLADLSSQQTAVNEEIMSNGLEMLGVSSAGTTRRTTTTTTVLKEKVVLQEPPVIKEEQKIVLKESDLLRSSHELVQGGSIEEGLDLLKSNLAIKEDLIAARYQYAVFLAQYNNDFKEASNQLEVILTNHPNNLPSNFFLGELAEAQGDFLSARNYYEKVEEINPKFPNVNNKLGMLISRRYKDQAGLAADYLEKAYANNPRDIDALYQLGVVQSENLSLPNEAIANFNKVVEENPRHPFVNYDLALIYYRMGAKQKALDNYLIACAINPELKTAENDLAFALPSVEKEAPIEVANTEDIAIKSAESEEPAVSQEPNEEETLPDYTLDLNGAVSAKEQPLSEEVEKIALTEESTPEAVAEEEPAIEEAVALASEDATQTEKVIPLSTLVKQEIEAETIEKNRISEEQLEAQFDEELGQLGAAGLGIAAGAAINGSLLEETVATEELTLEALVKEEEVETATTEEPATEAVAEEVEATVLTEEPATESVSEEMEKTALTEEPTPEAVAEEVAATEPIEEPAIEEEVKETALTEEPAIEPVIEEVAETPAVAETTIEAPSEKLSLVAETKMDLSEDSPTKILEATAIGALAEEEAPIVDSKIVLITGATSGIGKATAELFAQNGYKLILTGRRFSRLFKLKEQFENEYKTQIQLLPFDVRSAAAVKAAIEELDDDWRQVDILINNAGLALGFEPIHEGKLEDWETMIDTNVKGLLYMTRAIAPYMVKRKKGHIINISSIAGKEVYPNGGVYCATKHAVEALTKAMRIDLHKYNIRVSQVAPGHVEETEFAKVRFHGDTDKAKIYEDFVPVNSRDIADSIYFMASRPAHVNIQDIFIMGTQQASATITDRSGR